MAGRHHVRLLPMRLRLRERHRLHRGTQQRMPIHAGRPSHLRQRVPLDHRPRRLTTSTYLPKQRRPHQNGPHHDRSTKPQEVRRHSHATTERKTESIRHGLPAHLRRTAPSDNGPGTPAPPRTRLRRSRNLEILPRQRQPDSPPKRAALRLQRPDLPILHLRPRRPFQPQLEPRAHTLTDLTKGREPLPLTAPHPQTQKRNRAPAWHHEGTSTHPARRHAP